MSNFLRISSLISPANGNGVCIEFRHNWERVICGSGKGKRRYYISINRHLSQTVCNSFLNKDHMKSFLIL